MATQASLVGSLAQRESTSQDRGWRSVIRDGVLVGSGTIVGQVLGVATSLLLRTLLGPTQIGMWQALKLLLSYAGFVNLGVTKAAAREITIARGSDRPHDAYPSRDLAFSFSMATTVFYAVAILCAAGFLWIRETEASHSGWVFGLGVMAVVCLAQRYLTFQLVLLRAERLFATATRLAILESALTLIVCGAATWAFGLYGLIAGCLCVSVVVAWVARRSMIERPKWAWGLRAIVPLIAVGFPIVLTGLVMTLFQSVDKLMLLAFLPDGAYQLGLYSTALLVTTQLAGVSNILATTMAPRYGEALGRWSCERRVAELAAQASELHAAVAGIAAGGALVVGAPLLSWILPDYTGGLTALQWLVPGSLALAVALPATQFLVTTKRQNRGLLAACVALTAAACGNYGALSAGWGLNGVAAATCASQVLFALLVISGSFWNLLSGPQRVRYVAVLLGILCPTMVFAFVSSSIVNTTDAALPQAILGVLLVAATWFVACAATWHTGRWGEWWQRPWNKRS